VSNYLQRIASNAHKPSGKIHPILGSMFSGPRHSIEENVFVPHDHIPQGQTSSEAPPGFPEPPRTHSVPDAPQARVTVAEEAKPEKNLLKPFLPQQPTCHPVSSAGQEGYAIVPPQQEGARQTNRREQSYTPLVEAEFSPPAPKSILPVHSPASEASGLRKKQENGGSFKRTVRSAREPDEIQIHIGRIEVTAVQPAAPTPGASKPRRSARSLDEYLRRRDGKVV